MPNIPEVEPVVEEDVHERLKKTEALLDFYRSKLYGVSGMSFHDYEVVMGEIDRLGLMSVDDAAYERLMERAKSAQKA